MTRFFSQMVPTTGASNAVPGNTSTVVIANPANAHLPLPIGTYRKQQSCKFRVLPNKKLIRSISAQLIPAGVKGITQQNLRSNNASVTLAQVLF